MTTEGLLAFTLDTGLVFDPLDLAEEVTPEAVGVAISQRRYPLALAVGLRLGDRELVTRAAEAVPVTDSESSFSPDGGRVGKSARAVFPRSTLCVRVHASCVWLWQEGKEERV